jgi:hypothetical protein
MGLFGAYAFFIILAAISAAVATMSPRRLIYAVRESIITLMGDQVLHEAQKAMDAARSKTDIEVRRHITVVVLTDHRLILCHTDEHAPDDLLPEPYTSTSTEAISLSSVRSVVVNRMVANPATFAGGGEPTPSEAVLTVGWGGINRIDLEPAACSDPDCDADHGYTGMVVSDDFSLRVSSAADGQGAVDDLLVFAESLSARSPN